jgi:hypothetical protein
VLWGSVVREGEGFLAHRVAAVGPPGPHQYGGLACGRVLRAP